jgi:hypothetical protein
MIRNRNEPRINVTWLGGWSPDFIAAFDQFARVWDIEQVQLFKALREEYLQQCRDWDDETVEGLRSWRGLVLDNKIDIDAAMAEHARDLREMARIVGKTKADPQLVFDVLCILWSWSLFLEARHPVVGERGRWAMAGKQLRKDINQIVARQEALTERRRA